MTRSILIIAGPNGVGKTTFANEFLPNEASCAEFVNADLIAAGLSPFRADKAAFAAGRVMLARIDELVRAGQSFAVETTLATSVYVRLIPRWQRAGYAVKLCFLQLPDVELAIRRVERRVRFGGHDIPRPAIERRFERGLKNLRNRYLPLVDEWAIYDGSLDPPQILESGRNEMPAGTPPVIMEDSPKYPASADPASSPESPTERSAQDPDILGALPALARGAAKAVARDRAAGLEPVVRLDEMRDRAVMTDDGPTQESENS